MESKKRIFLDSSVILSALFSGKGASHFILFEPIDVELQISEYVFRETYRVIKNKYKSEQKPLLNRLFFMLAEAHVTFAHNPGKSELVNIEQIISKNDAPILSTALSHSDYLITLDNEFFDEKIIQTAVLRRLTILKPGEFLEKYKSGLSFI